MKRIKVNFIDREPAIYSMATFRLISTECNVIDIMDVETGEIIFVNEHCRCKRRDLLAEKLDPNYVPAYEF